MNDSNIVQQPKSYAKLLQKCADIGFTMPSDIYIGTLLKSLIAAKPNGRFLELGTGIGLSLAWMIDGMDPDSQITSVDNDPELISIVHEFWADDPRVQLICEDGSAWIKNYNGQPFDLIFADAWPGKYSEIDETLSLIKVGGMYVIDDMTAQDNWPDGHQDNVNSLISYLDERIDFTMTKMAWSTGVIIMTRQR